MRFTIAGVSFHLQQSEVERAMSGIKAEPVTGESVKIGRRTYPIKQVGSVITGQRPQDFNTPEVVRALTKLGFTCLPAAVAEPAPQPEPQYESPYEAPRVQPSDPLPHSAGFRDAGH
jgi:hypothetical protein